MRKFCATRHPAEPRNESEAVAPFCRAGLIVPKLGDLDENDHECVERQRFNQRQAENERELNTWTSSGVTRQPFGRRCPSFPLCQGANSRRERHRKAGCKSDPVNPAGCSTLSEGWYGEAHESDRHEKVAEYTSHGMFLLNMKCARGRCNAASGWLTSTRADALTLSSGFLSSASRVGRGTEFVRVAQTRELPLMFLGDGSLQINRRQQNKDVGLQQ